MRLALALVGVLAAFGYGWVVVRTAWHLSKPKREFFPDGYRPAGIPFERTHFQNSSGLWIAGWTAIRPEALGTLIFCHGTWSNHREMEGHAELLWHRGFSVMTFDFQGCGESAGGCTSLGLREADDLVAAIDYISGEARIDNLGVVGNSMGGVAAILAAARDDRIAAIVTDGAFAAAGRNLVSYAFSSVTGLPATLFQDAVVMVSQWLSGVRLDCINPVAAIAAISPRPIMLIHGVDDEMVRLDDAHSLYAAAGQPKTLWTVPDCLHVQSFRVQKEEYGRRLEEFFTTAFEKT